MTVEEYNNTWYVLQPHLYDVNNEKKFFNIRGTKRQFHSYTLRNGVFILYFESKPEEYTANSVAQAIPLNEFLESTGIILDL